MSQQAKAEMVVSIVRHMKGRELEAGLVRERGVGAEDRIEVRHPVPIPDPVHQGRRFKPLVAIILLGDPEPRITWCKEQYRGGVETALTAALREMA